MDPTLEPTETEMTGEGEEEKKPEDKKGRRKIKIELIEDKSRRHITFSKRKLGIMKKAWELATLTGTQVLLLVASETGHVYTFATPKLQPLITKPEGKNLIQACLNVPDPVQIAPPMGSPPRGPGRYDIPPQEPYDSSRPHYQPYPPPPQNFKGGYYPPGAPGGPQDQGEPTE